MSTKVTTSPHGYRLADSGTLALAQTLSGFQTKLVEWLVKELREAGFEEISGSTLIFLGSLDCGENYASAVARNLQISRQAVHKQVRDAEKLGWLQTTSDLVKRNQKTILFTGEGERLMSAARDLFLRLDDKLADDLPTRPGDLAKALKNLDFDK